MSPGQPSPATPAPGRWPTLRWADLSLAAVSLLLLAIHLRAGLRLSPDSHTYIAWAGLLRQDGFDVVRYLSHNHHVSSPGMYLLPVGLIAVLQQGFGQAWQTAFLVVNLGLMLALLVLFRQILLGLGARWQICALLYPAFLLSADLWTWPHFVLTDMLFALLVLGAVGLALRQGQPGWGRRCGGVLLLLLIMLTRPSAPPAVAVIGGFMLLGPRRPAALRGWSGPALLAATACLVALAALGYGWLMRSVLAGDIDSEQLAYLARMVAKGMVVHDRPDTFVANDGGILDIAGLYLRRMLAFYSPYASSYSLAHLLGNAVVLGLPLLGLLAWLSGRVRLTPPQGRAVGLLLALSLGFALFHAATLIDFDWRYRFPTLAPLLLFSAVVLEGLMPTPSGGRSAVGRPAARPGLAR